MMPLALAIALYGSQQDLRGNWHGVIPQFSVFEAVPLKKCVA